MADNKAKLEAASHLIASIFTIQKALKALDPDHNYSGIGNLLGDFGEFIAVNNYGLLKAPSGASSYDAINSKGKKIQIKTCFAASQIGFRGEADLLLVIGVKEGGEWEEIYFGDFAPVKKEARYSARDNKHMIPVSKLKKMKS